MDGLRPERDELDRFASRSGGAKSKSKPVKSPKQAGPRSNGNGSISALFIGSLIISLGLFGFLGWAYMQQRAEVSELNEQLSEAMDFINQSKLSMARFEGELTEAGASLEEAGTETEQQLKFLDSEMRKLWGVAGDRNRKAIGENRDAIAGIAVQIDQLKSKQLADLAKQLSSQQALVTELKKEVAKSGLQSDKLASLEKQMAATSGEVSLTRELLDERLGGLQNSIKGIDALRARTTENSSAIASIDASRSQLIERLVGLERRLNEVKLELSAIKAPSTSQN